MVVRCANPGCTREFRQLGKGRLYLLPPVVDLRTPFWDEPKLIEHCYWLCPECARTHTIVLEESKPVVRATALESVTTETRCELEFNCALSNWRTIP